jgi:purine-binding chemotaxis protein CheW
MDSTPSAQASAGRVCLIELAGKPYAVDVRTAKEIMVFESCTAVPQGPSHLLGVANLRGTVIPILDIQPLLGLPARRIGARTTVLVVSSAYQQVAVAVDCVLGLEPFTEVVPFSEAARSEYGDYALGLLLHADALVVFLNMPRVVEALRRDTVRADAAAPAVAGPATPQGSGGVPGS